MAAFALAGQAANSASNLLCDYLVWVRFSQVMNLPLWK